MLVLNVGHLTSIASELSVTLPFSKDLVKLVDISHAPVETQLRELDLNTDDLFTLFEVKLTSKSHSTHLPLTW